MTTGGLAFPGGGGQPGEHRRQSTNLADIVERVLDKGIVIAGDIRVNLLEIELLTIRIRLLIASVDKAREIGIDWWEHDPSLSSSQHELAAENRRLRERDRRAGKPVSGPHAPTARTSPGGWPWHGLGALAVEAVP